MSLPLESIRVLDLSRALSGPFCTMILADLGADVAKVEPLPDGEMIRGWGPFHEGIGVFYLSVNRNKRSLAVDFRSEKGLQLLRRLATSADVLVENFKPGTTRSMGIDYESLRDDNPRLIYASITGFGTEGPYGEWPGLDQIAQGMSGLMSISGYADGEPTRVGVPIGDLVAGMWTATGISAAIAQRHTTGEGQMVETSLLASLVGMLCVQGQRYLSLEDVPGRAGNDHPVIYPYGSFTASDGLLNLAAPTQSMWASLCRLLDLESLREHPDYLDNSARSQNRESLRQVLNERLAARPAMEWTRELIAAGIPAGPVFNLDQVFSDPHVMHNGLVEEVEHPVIGSLRQLSNPLRMGSIGKNTVRSHPPLLGENSEAVLAAFGLSPSEIADLVDTGVVAVAAPAEKP
jgi:crotonobetainyl-CoA:carnitine CoA-transferase CaiB-like acyl-CoA transferase